MSSEFWCFESDVDDSNDGDFCIAKPKMCLINTNLQRNFDELLKKTEQYASFLCSWEDEEEINGDKEDEEREEEVNGSCKRKRTSSSFSQSRLLSPSKTLRWYQIEGVEWLSRLYLNGMNGILADEMGLGKTVICISFLATLWENTKGSFIVICPLSTLSSWEKEFHDWCPTITVEIYHGTVDERKAHKTLISNRKDSMIILTTYEMVIKDSEFFTSLHFKYLIIDEGQRIKNERSILHQILLSVDSEARLIVTGTPLSNSLGELWALLSFLFPEVFPDKDAFQTWFDFSETLDQAIDKNCVCVDEEKMKTQKHFLAKLHRILKPFMLRRKKSEVETQIPPKCEVIVYCEMEECQQSMYDSIKEKKPNTFSLQNIVMQLRKVCNHPFLFDSDFTNQFYHFEQLESNSVSENGNNGTEVSSSQISFQMISSQTHKEMHYTLEQIIISCAKMSILDFLLNSLLKDGHKVLVFSQMTKMLNILEEYCVLKKFKYARLDGNLSREDRKSNIHSFNTDESCQVFLLSTRAGGLGVTLTAADTVVLYDSDWNPQNDRQAMDRCHRIGQTRNVVVYRLITPSTIESKVLRLSRKKLFLERLVIDRTLMKTLIEDEVENEVNEEGCQNANTNEQIGIRLNNKEALLMILDREKLFDCSVQARQGFEVNYYKD